MTIPLLHENRRPRPRVAPRTLLRRALHATSLLCLGACAAPLSDIHVAPLYTSMSTPGGGRRSEFMFGAAVDLLPAPGLRGEAATRRFGLRPIWTRSVDERGVLRTHFLSPFGQSSSSAETTTTSLFPLFYFSAYDTPDGTKKRDFVALPGLFWSQEGDTQRWAWFPFYGNLKSFIAYDELTFVLFPLYFRTRNAEEVSYNFLFPIFGYSSGGGAHDFRIWPLYGKASIEGKYDRRFALWPLFHYQRNFLGGGRIEPETMYFFFPLFGTTRRGTYRSYTFLWPIFGWAHDPRADFWAIDAWPLVRIQRGGKRPKAEIRTRVWPFYGHHRADGLETWTYLWPIVHVRQERRRDWERDSFHVLPFLQSSRRIDKLAGSETSYFKLWPLYQREQGDDLLRIAFPDLNPLPRYFALDFHYGWIYELARIERNEYGTSTRSWGALYRSEVGAGEDRTSLSGIFARRTYEEDGRPAKAYSFLLGLIRWKSVEGQGLTLMRPAFPGPGWPPLETPEPALEREL